MINIYELKLTNLQQEILRLLCVKAGTSLNQRQIANLLGVSQPAVMKALPALEQASHITLQQDKDTKRWSVGLNRAHHRVLQLKRVDNLQLIYETGLADYLETAFAGATLILFGSYSRGEDLRNSDIDLAVIGRPEKRVSLAPFEAALERRIHLSFFASWKGVHRHLKENLCNGIVLAGGVEL